MENIKTNSKIKDGIDIFIVVNKIIDNYIKDTEKNFNDDYKLTNLRLQKILYFLQGLHYVKFNIPLIEDDLEAWPYGPVSPKVYYYFKSSDREELLTKIPLNEKKEKELDEEQSVFIDDYLTILKKHSTNSLVDRTHKEDPWKDSYNTPYSTIQKEDIREFYTNKYNKKT